MQDITAPANVNTQHREPAKRSQSQFTVDVDSFCIRQCIRTNQPTFRV